MASGGGGNPRTAADKVLKVQDAVVAYLQQRLRRDVRTTVTQLLSPRRLHNTPVPKGQGKLCCFAMHREFQKETEKSIWRPPPAPAPLPPPLGARGADGGGFIEC